VIATVLAVVAIAAVVITIVVAGGGSSPTAATTTVASSRPPDTFFTPLAPPTGVTVTPAGNGTFTVAIPAVTGAVGYEIEPANGGDVVSVESAALPATIDGNGATTMCVVVRAVGNDGRLSRDSTAFCS